MAADSRRTQQGGMQRRRFLTLAAGAAGVSAVGAAFLGSRPASAPLAPAEDAAGPLGSDTDAAPTPAPGIATAAFATPEPIPEPPLRSRGREDLVLMAGTEWEATGTIFHSGSPGPRVMILGGVHGNEPGGWLAAEEIANWEVETGALVVLPRLNWRAAAAFERTLDGIADLNRAYPGDPNGVPMEVMAYEITELARYWRPHWLWDLHESWGFFRERGENRGSAFIGQTTTSTSYEAQETVDRVVGRANEQITPREQIESRVRVGGAWGGRARSSLGMGTHVRGVNPVLIEMGQMNQQESRRSYLHQLLVRELLTDLRMV